MVRKVLLSIGVLLISLFLMILFALVIGLIMKSKVPVVIMGSSVYTDSWDNGSVIAEGTWENAYKSFANNDNAYDIKLQVSKIACWRDTNQCNEAVALVSGTALLADLKHFDIERWDDKFIIYTHRQLCLSDIYTISRDTKQVSVVTSINKDAESIANCKGIENAEDDIKRLVDGYSVYRKLEDEARPTWLVILGILVSLGFFGYSLKKIWRNAKNAGV